jgi:hypothetical protein
MSVLQSNKEKAADLINYEVRYIENQILSLEHYWEAGIFFQSSFNLNNSLMSYSTYIKDAL